MRNEMRALIEELTAIRDKITVLTEETKEFQGDEPVWTRVDLLHADHDIDRAVGFLQKFFVNKYKPEEWVR